MAYLADIDPDNPLSRLQAASCEYRITLGPRGTEGVELAPCLNGHTYHDP